MMNKLEEAIVYATVMHQGRRRKFTNIPYILHPLEVAQILATMTDDEDVITAGILHDIVEDTDGTLEEIRRRFGERVAALVASESENKYPDEDPRVTWKRRKEESLQVLRDSEDIGVKMLWLADKLANIRSLAGACSERGEKIWQEMHQSDPAIQCWYYRSVAEEVELSLNKTGAFKEFIKQINFIWPSTFDSEKTKYRKYKEVSIDGCQRIGKGAKGDVYRYDDELVIKVYNDRNTYRDVEREIATSRRAFVLGIPTAISFGIVAVGERYGAMYELVDSDTVSAAIARNPGQIETYAKTMAQLAHTIHEIAVGDEDGFPGAKERMLSYVEDGLMYEDAALADECRQLIETIPDTEHLVHGDFHTGNVFLQNGEPLLIDMDRVSVGHPLFEISDLYYFYVMLGEEDAAVVEDFMGFSYRNAVRFFDLFLRHYLDTEDERCLQSVIDRAEFIGCIRRIHKLHGKKDCAGYLRRLRGMTEKLDTLCTDILG